MRIENRLKEVLKAIFEHARINDELSISSEGLDKLCGWLSDNLAVSFRIQDIPSLNLQVPNADTPPLPLRIYFALLIFILTIKDIILYIGYCSIFSLMNRVPVGLSAPHLSHAKYVFITAPRTIPRFRLLESLPRKDCIIVYLPNLNIKALWRIGEEYKKCHDLPWRFFTPIFPILEFFTKMFRYNLTQGIAIHWAAHKIFLKNKRKILEIHDTMFKFFLLQLWARKISLQCQTHCPKAVYVFDNDSAINSIPLVEEFHKRDFKTLHLQHGVNAKRDNYCYTPPLCQYMLCCSLRDKAQQVTNGVEPHRLFVFGAPLQTIEDSQKQKWDSKDQHDFMIIATVGPIRVQERSASLLSEFFHNHLPSSTILLRHHPRATRYERTIWEKGVPHAVISRHRSLGADLLSAKIPIVFSIDALVTCLRYHQKTIFCPNSEEFYDEIDFLRNQSFIKMAENSQEICRAVNDIGKGTNVEIDEHRQNKFLDDNFGINDFERVRATLVAAIEEIYQR